MLFVRVLRRVSTSMDIIGVFMGFREKIEADLDDITEGIFIGYGKPNPDRAGRRPFIFIPHTHDAPSKLGLIAMAKLLCEADAKNQIGLNSDSERVFDELIEMKLKEKGLTK